MVDGCWWGLPLSLSCQLRVSMQHCAELCHCCCACLRRYRSWIQRQVAAGMRVQLQLILSVPCTFTTGTQGETYSGVLVASYVPLLPFTSWLFLARHQGVLFACAGRQSCDGQECWCKIPVCIRHECAGGCCMQFACLVCFAGTIVVSTILLGSGYSSGRLLMCSPMLYHTGNWQGHCVGQVLRQSVD